MSSKQEIVRDSNGNATHIREVSDDGRRSDLYKFDNGLASILTEDHRGERVEVADHNRDGTTTAYEADNSLWSNSILGNGGRGPEKGGGSQPSAQEPVYETPDSEDDDSDNEISDETIASLAEACVNAIREVREEEEADEHEREQTRERDQIRQLEVMRAQEQKSKIYDPVDKLCALSPRELANRARYDNPDKEERELATLIQIGKMPDAELPPEIIWKSVLATEPKDSRQYAIYKIWKEEIQKEIEKRGQHRNKLIGGQEWERYEFIRDNPRHPFSFELSRTITEKSHLLELLNLNACLDTNAIYKQLDIIDKQERAQGQRDFMLKAVFFPLVAIGYLAGWAYRKISSHK